MHEVLHNLNKANGVTGSMLVGTDGIVIVSDLDMGHEDETVGALASSIAGTVTRSVDQLGQGPFDQITVETDVGKMFLSRTDVGTLVVTSDPSANIGLVRLEIKQAIAELAERH